jgi:hypothetical protein
MLWRPGVLVILALGVVSVWLGSRGGGTDTEALASAETGPAGGAARDLRPQLLFLAGLAGTSLYAVWSSSQLSPLGGMFSMGVGIASFALAAYLAFGIGLGGMDSPLNFDTEARPGIDNEPAGRRLWPNVAWFAMLTLTTALLGFLLATTLFFVSFLRVKAKTAWPTTLVLTLSALVLLAALTNALLVELPAGLLQDYVPLPWPFR